MSDVKLVAFLPWLTLKDEHEVVGVRFVPFLDSRGSVHPSLSAEAEAFARIFSSYTDVAGRPIANCTFVTIPGREWRVTPGDSDLVEESVALLFLSSWAANNYFPRFGGPYVNASQFGVMWQRFDDATWITLSAKRLDGSSMDGGYRHGEVHFTRPLQCSFGEFAAIDPALLTGLESARAAGSLVTERLATALSFVQLANTDNDLMSRSAEVILMASAFEQLFDADASKQQLKEGLGNLLSEFGSITADEASTKRPPIKFHPDHEAGQRSGWVHRMWIEELYDLRSKLVHRGTRDMRQWAWSPREHLLMAAWVFPLAAKLMLAAEGNYALTTDDRGRSFSIDKLLGETEWSKPVAGEDRTHKWAEVVEASLEPVRRVK